TSRPALRPPRSPLEVPAPLPPPAAFRGQPHGPDGEKPGRVLRIGLHPDLPRHAVWTRHTSHLDPAIRHRIPLPTLSHAACRGACGSLRDRLPLLLLVVKVLPDPRLGEQAPDRLRRLRPPVEPLERHLLVDEEPRGILLVVVYLDTLDVSAVPALPGIAQ